MNNRLLFLSNGHGEDLNSCCIIQTLTKKYPQVEVAAMPIVGEGEAYHQLGIPIIGPVQTMPSGGIFYMNPLSLLKDISSGLISLTWQQIQATWAYSRNCKLIFATGDIVVAAIAYSTGLPYVMFLSGHSSYYEGRLNLELPLWQLLKSSRCLEVFTRDAFTASDLRQQGLTKAKFLGNPAMDNLYPQRKNLLLKPETSTIAIFPGSRLPEAIKNFHMLLRLAKEIAIVMHPKPVQFCAALVPRLMAQLEELFPQENWQYSAGKLKFQESGFSAEVLCHTDAFADILDQSHLVLGMTGTAIEQAVGLGKPVITVPGEGPAFTYRFAEAQQRLLGESVQVIGTKPINTTILQQAALRVHQTLQDEIYLKKCTCNGLERMGLAGASAKITSYLADSLGIQR